MRPATGLGTDSLAVVQLYHNFLIHNPKNWNFHTAMPYIWEKDRTLRLPGIAEGVVGVTSRLEGVQQLGDLGVDQCCCEPLPSCYAYFPWLSKIVTVTGKFLKKVFAFIVFFHATFLLLVTRSQQRRTFCASLLPLVDPPRHGVGLCQKINFNQFPVNFHLFYNRKDQHD